MKCDYTHKAFQPGPAAVFIKWCNITIHEQHKVFLNMQNMGLAVTQLLTGVLPLTVFLIYCCKYAP